LVTGPLPERELPPQACAEERWLQIERDKRWPEDLAELTKRGFAIDTDAEPPGHGGGRLARAMNITVQILGLYPVVTSQSSSTALYQLPDHLK
jgi:hypothetical protein